MAGRTGKCINFGLCTKADAKEIVSPGDVGEFSCPECGRPLEPSVGEKTALALPIRLIVVACLVVAVGGAIYLLWPRSPQSAAVATPVDGVIPDSNVVSPPNHNPNPDPNSKSPPVLPPVPVQKTENNKPKPTEDTRPIDPIVISSDDTHTPPPPVLEPKPIEESPYTGPSSGLIVWSGTVQGTDLVTIDESGSSVGVVLSGTLPGVPVIIQPQDPKAAVIAASPAPDNKYRRVVFRIRGKGPKQVTLRWTLP
jgi:hypothetical protein